MIKNYYFDINQTSFLIDLEKSSVETHLNSEVLKYLIVPKLDVFLEKISIFSIKKNSTKEFDFSSEKNIINFMTKNNSLMFEHKNESYFININLKAQKDHLLYFDLMYVKIPKKESIQESIFYKTDIIDYDHLNDEFLKITSKYRDGNFFVLDFNSLPIFENNIFVITNIVASIFGKITEIKELLATVDNKILVIYNKNINNLKVANVIDEILNEYTNIDLNYFYGKFDQYNFYEKYQIEKLFNGYSKLNQEESSFHTFYEKKKFYDKVYQEIGQYVEQHQNIQIIQNELNDENSHTELMLDMQDQNLFYLSLMRPEVAYKALIDLIQKANSIIQSNEKAKVIISIPIWFVIFSNNLNYLFSNIILNFKNEFIEECEGYFTSTVENIRRINSKELLKTTIEYKIDDCFSNNYNLYGFKTVLIRNQYKDTEKYDTEEQYKWQLFSSKTTLLKTNKLFI